MSGAGSVLASLATAPSAIALRFVATLRHDVQQDDRDAGIGDMGGDAAAHHAGAEYGGFLDRHDQTASRMVAMPWPPPMHCVASA
ncbi:MAG: hypothetical protein WDN69_18270 [Aliidongia sp.]